MLKDLKTGAKVKLSKLSHDEHKTTPPPRLSEVRLVSELESRDIGRPATYSSIVSLIQERGYVAKKGSQLYPTPLGFAVARLLAAKFPNFTNYAYTATMEQELDDIAAQSVTRPQFLATFWRGKKGFKALLDDLMENVDFNEIEKYSTIDLHNGYNIRFSRFGTFLQHAEGKPNEKGFLPSVRLDDQADVWDYREADACREAFEAAANRVDARVLGVLESGEYEGWTVWARDGKFGPYLQALHPKAVAAQEAGKKPAASVPKPINQALPEGQELATVELEAVAILFAEVKLPRHLSDTVFVGLGKRGAWIGRKASAKARRAVFISMPEEFEPRTISLEEATKVWDDKQAAKAAPKTSAKTAAKPKAATKAAPKKAAAPRKAPAKKPAPKKEK